MSNLSVLPPRPPRQSRLSEKLRVAIHARVTQGMTITDACNKAGLSTAGWFKAMQRPAVAEYVQEVKAKFVAEADQMRAHAKTLAIAEAVKLMTSSKDEKIRARMAEFLAGDGKTPAVAVNVDMRHLPPANYTVTRPTVIEGE